MSSQGENSSNLKAGNTRLKGTTKVSGVGANISKKGFSRLKGQISGTKTSQSEMDANIVVVDGKVRTPKELITDKYRQYTQEYLKLLQSKNDLERKERENIDSKVKSILNSHNDSQMKANTSSNLQQKSQFMQSSKSEADSQNQSKKQKHVVEKRDPKALSIQDLQQNIQIKLQQTQTIYTFNLPSVSFKNDNDKMKLTNANYRQYCSKRIGSDNYIARPVQTFNYQHKKMAQSVQRSNTNQTGIFASGWDIQDLMKQQKKSQFQILQQDIKNNVQRQFNQFLVNPFSLLPLDKQSIQIHSKFPVPGAAQYLLKQKDGSNNRSKKHGIATGNTGLNQASSANNRQTESRQNDSSQKQKSSQGNSNSKKGLRNAQMPLQASQQQQKIEEQQKQLLQKLMQKAKQMPSEQERKLMVNQNLQKMLKYIDRILNSQTFHRQYILYRNYPEIEFTKRSPQDQLGRGFKKKKQQTKKQQVKQPLQYLFSFKCKMLQKYSVTSADWNPVNKDLLAVTYQMMQKDNDSNDKQGTNKGYLAFWTLKNPAFPQKFFSSQSRITCCKFSVQNPNLIACGTFDGVVTIYDIRKKDNKPIAQNKQSMDKNTNAIWDIQWISKGKGNKGQSLVSISADGRITEWSMKKGLEYTDLMLLKRIAPTNKKDAVQNMNFRFASGLSFEFLKGQSSMYLATTQEGVIYRCSKSYTQQSLQVYLGHNGPIYKVHTNPFFHDLFLTCSADWSCKLWNWRQDQALFSFQSLDLTDQVIDIQWSPTESTVFASVCKDGRLQLWDLQKKNMLDPISIIKGNSSQDKPASKTMVRFCHGAPVLITGDVTGDVSVYRLNREQQNLDQAYQCEKLMKLIYPNGYKMGVHTEQITQQKKQQ